jgi:hypothetical protein
MTSPYAYHILHNVTVYTVQGLRSLVGNPNPAQPAYQTSTHFPLFTFSQPSSSILSQTKECHKSSPHGTTRCTISFNPNFLIQDLFTVNAKNYYEGELTTPTTATICQASYVPTIALPLSEMAGQNGVVEECEWTQERSGRTTVVGPDVITFSYFGAEAYHAITTGGKEEVGTEVPRPGSGTGMTSKAVQTSAG